MSAFNPMAFNSGPYQKKQLIQRLMEQYQQSAGRAAGLASTPSVGGVGVGRTHPFGGRGFFTHIGPSMPSALAAALGPGAMGLATANEHSAAEGMPAPHPVYANPNLGSSISAVSPLLSSFPAAPPGGLPAVLSGLRPFVAAAMPASGSVMPIRGAY